MPLIFYLTRHLRELGYGHSIIRDKAFRTSKMVLEGKARQLRSQGKGKVPSLTEAEEKILWESNQPGKKSPRSLIQTIWWNICLHLSLIALDVMRLLVQIQNI